MLRAGLIGNPVAHSRSPRMHNAAFAELGIDAHYELWLTELEDIPARVASLRTPGMLGANVTVPHKQAVMPYCDRLTETAARAGAVNTIIPTVDGLLGENTDVYGFAQAVRDEIGGRVPYHALLLGAGGAARGVVVAMQELGIERITIANRTLSKAQELSHALDVPNRPSIEVVSLAHLASSSWLAGIDLLVNSTSIGWHGEELPVPSAVIEALDRSALVVDLTYRETAMLRLARAHGFSVMDGFGMLLHQGARAWELWTGQEAPVSVMRAAMMSDTD